MLLRPRQEQFVARAREALAKHGNTLAVAPTGFGKTVALSAAILEELPQRGTTVVLQHRDELVAQNRAAFVRMAGARGPRSSVINSKIRDPHGKVIFAMVQSLANVLEILPANIGLVATDETHHAAAKTYRKIYEHIRSTSSQVAFLGVTATPERGDKKSLLGVYNNVCDVVTLGEIIRAGNLVRPRAMVVDIGVQGELGRVKRTAADFDMGEVEEIMDKTVHHEAVIKHWREAAGDRQTVVFCSTVAHSQHVCEAFRAAGVKAEHIDGATPAAERAAILRRFDRGEFQVLCNVMVLTEGWDCLDEATEVLTPEGWRGHDGLAIGGEVCACDPTTGAVRAVRIDDLGRRQVRRGERMVEIASQHVNVRVTEGHRLLVSRGRRGDGVFMEAGRLAELKSGEYALPVSGLAAFPGVPLTDDQLKLVAWFITDGYLTKAGRLQIYQTVGKYADRIRDLIAKCGLRSTEFVRPVGSRATGGYRQSSDLVVFGVGKRQLGHLVSYLDKEISPELSHMSITQFSLFWSELILGDGHAQPGKSGWLWTGREAVKDRLMAMAVVRGMSASAAQHNGSWRLSLRPTTWLRSNLADERSAAVRFVDPEPGETVWCLTNELGTLITRRAGKVAVVGNCQPVSCVVLLRPSSHASTMIQMIGRGLRKQDPERYPHRPPKRDCIIMDFGTSLLTHGTLDADVTLDPRKGAARTKVCPSCTCEIPAGCRTCPLCQHAFPELISDRLAAGVKRADDLQDFVLTEIDILNASPFRWETLWQGDVLMASGFSAWAMAIHYRGAWYAVGGSKEKGVHVLDAGCAASLQAIASADDWMRQHGDRSDAGKAKRWLLEPATPAQIGALRRHGPVNDNGLTKYLAGCMLTYKANENVVRSKVIGAAA